MTVYFNNCGNRQHAQIYGRDDAFFDLYATGRHAKMALGLVQGDRCVVVSRLGSTHVKIRVYAFDHESARSSERNESVRVFHGTEIKSEGAELLKSDAAASKEYSIFFDSRGYFKRASVV